MIDKKVFSLVSGSLLRVVLIVFLRWIALLANVVTMTEIGAWIESTLSANTWAPSQTIMTTLIAAVIIRTFATYLAQRISDDLAQRAKASVRQEVYDKLQRLGPSYDEIVSTSEAVQTSVDGASQLEVFFGGFLPQLIYAVVAPITLFFLLVGSAGLAPVILLVLVPLIPVSIVFIQRPARTAAKKY